MKLTLLLLVALSVSIGIISFAASDHHSREKWDRRYSSHPPPPPPPNHRNNNNFRQHSPDVFWKTNRHGSHQHHHHQHVSTSSEYDDQNERPREKPQQENDDGKVPVINEENGEKPNISVNNDDISSKTNDIEKTHQPPPNALQEETNKENDQPPNETNNKLPENQVQNSIELPVEEKTKGEEELKLVSSVGANQMREDSASRSIHHDHRPWARALFQHHFRALKHRPRPASLQHQHQHRHHDSHAHSPSHYHREHSPHHHNHPPPREKQNDQTELVHFMAGESGGNTASVSHVPHSRIADHLITSGSIDNTKENVLMQVDRPADIIIRNTFQEQPKQWIDLRITIDENGVLNVEAGPQGIARAANNATSSGVSDSAVEAPTPSPPHHWGHMGAGIEEQPHEQSPFHGHQHEPQGFTLDHGHHHHGYLHHVAHYEPTRLFWAHQHHHYQHHHQPYHQHPHQPLFTQPLQVHNALPPPPPPPSVIPPQQQHHNPLQQQKETTTKNTNNNSENEKSTKKENIVAASASWSKEEQANPIDLGLNLKRDNVKAVSGLSTSHSTGESSKQEQKQAVIKPVISIDDHSNSGCPKLSCAGAAALSHICPGGLSKLDLENGCPTCDCCPDIVCRTKCPNGYKSDQFGCPICRCSSP